VSAYYWVLAGLIFWHGAFIPIRKFFIYPLSAVSTYLLDIPLLIIPSLLLVCSLVLIIQGLHAYSVWGYEFAIVFQSIALFCSIIATVFQPMFGIASGLFNGLIWFLLLSSPASGEIFAAKDETVLLHAQRHSWMKRIALTTMVILNLSLVGWCVVNVWVQRQQCLGTAPCAVWRG
jgi:hypothetical protein